MERFFLQKTKRTPLFNNCAGKHLGFCHWSLFKGFDPKGYNEVAHPAQQQLLRNIRRLGLVRELESGIDGCGVPNFALTLTELNHVYHAWMQSSEGRVLIEAMRKNPHLISGETSFDTWVIRQSQGAVVTKGGAEGLGVALLPAAEIVVAVKALDGAARAAQAAMSAILGALFDTPEQFRQALHARLAEPILNWAGESTGQIRVQGVAL
jgi:L-asparaginase II